MRVPETRWVDGRLFVSAENVPGMLVWLSADDIRRVEPAMRNSDGSRGCWVTTKSNGNFRYEGEVHEVMEVLSGYRACLACTFLRRTGRSSPCKSCMKLIGGSNGSG